MQPRPSMAAVRAMFMPGQVVTVTNHYINLPDHPCFGTKQRTIAKVTSSHLHFTESGNVPWPKAKDVEVVDGVVAFYGFPQWGNLFLTIDLRGSHAQP